MFVVRIIRRTERFHTEVDANPVFHTCHRIKRYLESIDNGLIPELSDVRKKFAETMSRLYGAAHILVVLPIAGGAQDESFTYVIDASGFDADFLSALGAGNDDEALRHVWNFPVKGVC